jgi:hypothetical protein
MIFYRKRNKSSGDGEENGALMAPVVQESFNDAVLDNGSNGEENAV